MRTRSYNSKSVRLVEAISGDIRRGRFNSADPLPGEEHLASCYEVSRATVRRALQLLVERNELIREPNRGVWISGPAVPQPPADRRREGARSGNSRGHSIGMCWVGPSDAFTLAVQTGMRSFAGEPPIDISCLGIDGSHSEVVKVLEAPWQYGFDGLICFPYEREDYRRSAEKLLQRNFPLVFVDRPLDGLEVPTVEADNAAGTYEATHFLILTHGEPVRFFGSYSPDVRTLRMRHEGYVRAMHDAGFTPEPPIWTRNLEGNPDYWGPDRNYREPARVIGDFLRQAKLPVNLVCSNTHMARGVYAACGELGLQIGRDVRVIGFDDLPMAKLLNPPMSVVNQPAERIGFEAMKFVRNWQEGVRPPRLLTLPVELIIRSSHGEKCQNTTGR